MNVAVWNIYTKARDTQTNLDTITSSYEEMYQREQELAASVEAFDTSFGIETEIRDKYGLVKEGEEVVVIVEDESLQDVEQEQEKGWWEKLKGLF